MPNRISFSPVTGDFVDPAYPIDEVFGVELVELEQEELGVQESLDILSKAGITADYLPPESNGYLLHFEAGENRIICPRGPMADWMIQWLEAMFKALGSRLFETTGISKYGTDLERGRMWIEVDWFTDKYLPLIPKDTANIASVFETQLQHLTTALDALAQHGAVHCDIRPDFLFVHAGRDQIRIIGFGLGLMIAAQREAIFSGLGTSIGDPRTMAPEVVTGALPTPQSDSYSAAVALLWAIGLVDPVRHADPLFGTEAIAARQGLRPADWLGRGIDSAQRDSLVQKLTPYLEPDLLQRRSTLQAVPVAETDQSTSGSFWQQIRALFRRGKEAKPPEEESTAAPSEPKPRIHISRKFVLIAVALAVPVFGAGVFVSAKFRKAPHTEASDSHASAPSHSLPWHSMSSSSASHGAKRHRKPSEADDDANSAASASAAPLLNLDPEKCKKDLDALTKKVEMDLQFWGGAGDVVLCSSRDGRSLCCNSLLYLQGCALLLKQKIAIDVYSANDSELRIRTEAMQKEAASCGISPSIVRQNPQDRRRSVDVSLSGN